MPNELEEEFKKEYEAVAGKMKDLLDKADKLIEEAVKLSNETGVPLRFRPWSDFNSRRYVPEKFWEKFKELDDEFVDDVCNVYPQRNYGPIDGWEPWNSSSLTC